MRRVMVTPTFAAGLGVVIAAVLAYPVTKTVIQIGSPDPGRQCPVRHCGTGQTRVGGGLASVAPGERLVTPSPSAAQPTSAGHNPAPGKPPAMSYQTLYRWPGGFTGEVTIEAPAPSTGNWRLQLTFRSGQIQRVWGGQWQRSGAHTVVIEAWDWAGPDSGGQGIRVMVQATGRASPPSRCTFDGRACVRVPAHGSPGIPRR